MKEPFCVYSSRDNCTTCLNVLVESSETRCDPLQSKNGESSTLKMSKTLSSKRAAMAANRLKGYQDRFSATNQFISSANGPLSSHRISLPAKAAVQSNEPLKLQTHFDPSQLDGPANLEGLPGLKPSAVMVEAISVQDKVREEQRLREEKERQMECERRRMEELKMEEERQEKEKQVKEERERQEKLKVQYEIERAEEPIDERGKCDSFDLPKDDEVKEEDKRPEEPVPESMPVPETADPVKEFLAVLLSPETPASKKREMMLMPLPKSIKKLQCTIHRDKRSLAKKMYPRFNLMVSHTQDFLLSAQKMTMVGSAHYIITTDQHNMTRKTEGYLGKVRSDVAGHEYNLFGVGENPSKGLGPGRTRNQLAGVFYEHEQGNGRTPRKINVVIPQLEEGAPVEWKPMKKEEHLLYQFKCGFTKKLIVLKNKTPTWNSSLKAYVLNFFGRVALPSVKNFQLIDPENEKEIVMQFGRVDDSFFNMDLSWPLSIVQAYGIAISAFSYNH